MSWVPSRTPDPSGSVNSIGQPAGLAIISDGAGGSTWGASQLLPRAVGTDDIGSVALPFRQIRANELISGDVLFTDTHCVRCGTAFRPDEVLVLRVLTVISDKGASDPKQTLTRTVPVHKDCVVLPGKDDLLPFDPPEHSAVRPAGR